MAKDEAAEKEYLERKAKAKRVGEYRVKSSAPFVLIVKDREGDQYEIVVNFGVAKVHDLGKNAATNITDFDVEFFVNIQPYKATR